MKRIIIALCMLYLFGGNLSAKVVLPQILSDHAVLQQQTEVKLWGKAVPNTTVNVTPSWNNQTITAQSDNEGRWQVSIQTPAADFTPYSIEFSDGEITRIQNILIGEVWFCSGQSNMEMPLGGWGKITNYQKEIAEAGHSNIRLLQIEQINSTQPETNIKVRNDSWQVCSPITIPEFSATAYFFGREISEKQNVPVGLIHTSWGGTNVESWISGEVLKEMPEFVKTVESIQKMPGDKKILKAEYLKELTAWNNRVDEGFAEGKPVRAAASLDDKDWEKYEFPG